MNGRPIPGRPGIRRAYRDALGLIAVAAGPTLYRSATIFADTLGFAVPQPAAELVGHLVSLAATLAGGRWLLHLIEVRLHGNGRRQFRLQLTATAVAVADGIDIAIGVYGGDSTRLPAMVLAVWLAWEVIRARGISTDEFETPLGRVPWWTPSWLVAAVALAAFIATGRLSTGLHGYGPTTSGSQLAILSIDNPMILASRIAWTSMIEELVVTAAVITLLRQARRPVWEWTLLVVGVRVLGHAYLGTPALAQILIGLVAVLLYVRCRGLAPLIVVHFLYDLEPTVPISALAAILAMAIHTIYQTVTTPAPDTGDNTGTGSTPSSRKIRSLR
ncbi:CPBP family intramembrane glutamic endopeptidase [Streptomyces sp. NPDC000594]|uniref:CPBP family intramembrane glutamic endopeptidase n=1 Tax=Streptomyces sp. NPDC000594 TaxID=3154261 RepID=UPI00332A2D0E